MLNSRTLAIGAFALLLSTQSLEAQSRAQYRDFQLGGNLASVATLARISASDTKVIHQRRACCYRFASADGLPPRDDRFELVFAGDTEGVLQLKHQGTWRVFPTADALSEFLLLPVFTGRPR